MKFILWKKSLKNDTELIAAIKSADKTLNNLAFRHIYDTYRPEILRFIRWKGFESEEDQQEIFQIALLRIVENKFRLELSTDVSFKTILKRYTENVLFEKYRERSKADKHQSIEERKAGVDEENEEEDRNADSLELDTNLFTDLDNQRSDLITKIQEALRELTGKHCRDIYTMKYYYHDTDQEIADELKVTRQTISELKNGKCQRELEQILRGKGVGIPKIHRTL